MQNVLITCYRSQNTIGVLFILIMLIIALDSHFASIKSAPYNLEKFCTLGFLLFSCVLSYSLKIFIYVYICVVAQKAFNILCKDLFHFCVSINDLD